LMVAQVTGLEPADLIHTFGDTHIYLNHIEQVETLLEREPYPLPQLRLNPERKRLDDFVFEDFELVGYQAHPPIKAPIAI